MQSENLRKPQQASRNGSKSKRCGELLRRMIGILRKLALDTRLIDLEQHERLRQLRTERLKTSVKTMFTTRVNPYPSQSVRNVWRHREGSDFPFSEAEWPAEEARRIKAAKESQQEEESIYRYQYKKAQLEVLCQLLATLPEGFGDHVLDGKQPDTVTHQDIDSAVSRYNWYRFHHDFMRSLVDAAGRREKARSFQLPNALPSGAYIDAKGCFRPRLAPIVEALDGVEIDRIRMCANKSCRRIFWAGRIAKPGSEKNDQVCCSPECSHASRNQRLRARYSDPADDFAARKLTANEKSLKRKARRKGE